VKKEPFSRLMIMRKRKADEEKNIEKTEDNTKKSNDDVLKK
jgi:hypothetical protein